MDRLEDELYIPEDDADLEDEELGSEEDEAIKRILAEMMAKKKPRAPKSSAGQVRKLGYLDEEASNAARQLALVSDTRKLNGMDVGRPQRIRNKQRMVQELIAELQQDEAVYAEDLMEYQTNRAKDRYAKEQERAYKSHGRDIERARRQSESAAKKKEREATKAKREEERTKKKADKENSSTGNPLSDAIKKALAQ